MLPSVQSGSVPVQPAKVEPGSGVAARLTTVPGGKVRRTSRPAIDSGWAAGHNAEAGSRLGEGESVTRKISKLPLGRANRLKRRAQELGRSELVSVLSDGAIERMVSVG